MCVCVCGSKRDQLTVPTYIASLMFLLFQAHTRSRCVLCCSPWCEAIYLIDWTRPATRLCFGCISIHNNAHLLSWNERPFHLLQYNTWGEYFNEIGLSKMPQVKFMLARTKRKQNSIKAEADLIWRVESEWEETFLYRSGRAKVFIEEEEKRTS